jgi:hypothetical protein
VWKSPNGPNDNVVEDITVLEQSANIALHHVVRSFKLTSDHSHVLVLCFFSSFGVLDKHHRRFIVYNHI